MVSTGSQDGVFHNLTNPDLIQLLNCLIVSDGPGASERGLQQRDEHKFYKQKRRGDPSEKPVSCYNSLTVPESELGTESEILLLGQPTSEFQRLKRLVKGQVLTPCILRHFTAGVSLAACNVVSFGLW